ncbi:hypothetical protein ASG31_04325 [Chryseobacterium sp. Leaf404]|uniref:hypothetical protein n=1 Tax=unclassified Chryseobacterium TaxID=2593645 RepID=UPI0007005D17|nr:MULTISPECIES: hypothetical protein [unclassified Chryseobacterium]KQT17969.1 hypothetical protein ASG31_04325 [Chryseobacterium sp. Leaf404]
MKYFYFDFKLFLILIFTFIIMTVVGTLSHELGHYAVAEYLGYDATIDYQSTHFESDKKISYLNSIYQKYAYEIKNNLNFPEKEEFDIKRKEFRNDRIKILAGGPLQTMITGTFGFVLLLIYRKKLFSFNKTTFTGWILVFCSLFWLRQSANSFGWTLNYIFTGEKSMRGDELRLARFLDLNIWTIHSITGIIGLIVLFTVLRLLPKNQVLTFLCAGLLGGCLGFYLWLIKFGQYILP